MPRCKNLNSKRKPRGQVALELAVACLLLLPLSIIGFSMITCEIASSLNDRACRNAARAAVDASNYDASLLRAQAAISANCTSGIMYGPVSLDVGKFVFEDFGGSPPPNTDPYVSVTTIMPCVIPAPINLLGNKIGITQKVNFTRTYKFPIVKLKLYFP
ncbi:MAG: hypothetical protein C0507_09835 [Cyanobacteria bacterium PR.3.49]|nr:hypothetical protein [Cyanobacteria bacterium PR.3.49]